MKILSKFKPDQTIRISLEMHRELLRYARSYNRLVVSGNDLNDINLYSDHPSHYQENKSKRIALTETCVLYISGSIITSVEDPETCLTKSGHLTYKTESYDSDITCVDIKFEDAIKL